MVTGLEPPLLDGSRCLIFFGGIMIHKDIYLKFQLGQMSHNVKYLVYELSEFGICCSF